MKNLYTLPALILCLAFQSCDKNTPAGTTTQAPVDFNVQGIGDMQMPANDSTMMKLEVKHLSGSREPLAVFASGFPLKVTHRFSTDSDTPDFSTVLSVQGNFAAEGVYPIKIKAVGISAAKEYTFNLAITKPTDCATNTAGMYTAVRKCGSDATYDIPVSITKDASNTDAVLLDNMGPALLPAMLDCPNGLITIPPLKVEDGVNATVWRGNGKFTGNSMTFTVFIQHYKNNMATNGSVCYYTLAR